MKKKIVIRGLLLAIIIVVLSFGGIYISGLYKSIFNNPGNSLAGIFKSGDKKDSNAGLLKDSTSNVKEADVFDKIRSDYAQKGIYHLECSEAFFYAAFLQDDSENQYRGLLPKGMDIDMRGHLQNLVNNYDKLDKQLQEELQKVIFPENGKVSERDKKTTLEDYPGIFFTTRVYAEEEELFQPFSYGIMEGISVKTFDPLYMDEMGAGISLTVMDSVAVFEELCFSRPSFDIEIIPGHQPDFIRSYSVFVPADLFVPGKKAVYRIYLNAGCDEKTLTASLIHELFHAFQQEVWNVSLLAAAMDERAEWLRESTALWAVDQVYPDLDYEHEFAETIYAHPTVDFSSMYEYRHHTWYQMFFYFTEVIKTCENDYVKKLFSSYHLNGNLDAAISDVHNGRQFFNTDFAKLGMALAGGVEENLSFQWEDPGYPDIQMDVEENASDLEEMTDTHGSEWREQVFESPGFWYKMVEIPPDFDGKITFMQNLSMVRDDQLTGMRIAVHKDGEWKWEHTPLEPPIHVVDIGGSLEAIDAVMIMLYSTGFESTEKVQYKLATGATEKAKGSIQYKWEKEFKTSGSDESENETVTVIISESLKRIPVKNDGTMDEAALALALGESFLIEDMQVDYVYRHLQKKGKEENKTTGVGSYSYKESTDSGSDSAIPELPGLPDISGLKDTLGKGLSELTDQLQDAMKGLNELNESGDSEGSEEGSEEYIPPLPELDLEVIMPNFPELSDSLGLITGGGLARLVVRPEVDVIELLPSLPVRILSDEWVDYEHVHIFPDPENERSLKTDKQNYKGKASDLFPLWFVNPEFNPEGSMEDIDMEALQDTKELTQGIVDLQAKFNRFNISRLTKDPQTGFQVDMRNFIDPRPESAVMIEKAMFNDKVFEAEFSAKTVTKKGNVIKITVTVKYEFN